MESDTPIELLVSREWNGTKWHYPNIERMVEENKRLRADLAAAIKQRKDTRRWLRDACAEIARIETRFYDALTPQQIAERNGWDCFAEKEGGGA